MTEKIIKKIMIIDDEQDFCYFIKKNLELTGDYTVISATAGTVGIWLAHCKEHKPDLIFLDIMMPGVNGYEVLKRLKEDEATSYIPIIMFTARNDFASKIVAKGLCCDDYIVKPVEIQFLKSKIENMFAEYNTNMNKNL